MWPQARAARGGHDQIKARIDLLVAQTNTVYETSGADQRINLVAAEEVEGYTEVVQPSWSSLPGGVAPTVTDRLRGSSDGYMDEIHAVRDRVWADIVVLFREQAGGPSFSGCTQLLRFSNPNQIHPDPGADPMGVALTADNAGVTGVDGPADAVRALNSTRTIVAERRQGRAVTVAFKGGPYSPAVEGGSASTVTVRLNAAPSRELVIPLTATGTSGAWAGDYGVTPLSVVFGAEETERTVTVTAVDDAAQEDAETLILAFDETLPAGVTAASPDSATVTLTDNDTVTVAPSIGTVTISSDPGVGGVYTVGEEIEVTVVFNKPVTVTGRPQLEVTVGTAPEQAVNQSGRSASEVLVFAYAVVAGDSDADGVSIAADSLTLNGGTITDSTNRDAALGHSAVGDTGDPVDGITPVLQTATVDAAVMTLTYDAALDEMSTPATSAFAVTVDGAAQSVLSVQVAESVVTLELDTRVVFEQVVRLSYTPGAQPVRGGNGNPVASLSSRLVTNQSPEPVYDADADATACRRRPERRRIERPFPWGFGTRKCVWPAVPEDAGAMSCWRTWTSTPAATARPMRTTGTGTPAPAGTPSGHRAHPMRSMRPSRGTDTPSATCSSIDPRQAMSGSSASRTRPPSCVMCVWWQST